MAYTECTPGHRYTDNAQRVYRAHPWHIQDVPQARYTDNTQRVYRAYPCHIQNVPRATGIQIIPKGFTEHTNHNPWHIQNVPQATDIQITPKGFTEHTHGIYRMYTQATSIQNGSASIQIILPSTQIEQAGKN